jgi:DNA repair protein RecO (recombination protein O)
MGADSDAKNSRARNGRAKKSHRTAALVLRRTPYRDADLVVTLFTESLGQVSALARAARNSQRRFGGGLEPFHTLDAELDEAPGAELMALTSVRVETARAHLYGNLGAMEAAGKFLNWIRQASPAHTPEPEVWQLSLACLDELNAVSGPPPADHGATASASSSAGRPSPTLILATFGLQLLAASGWRLELERCVLSGARCPDGKSAMVDPERGGLVSRAEGGAPFLVSGAARARLIAAQNGQSEALDEEDAALGLELVERCLRAHAGLSP